MSRVPERNVNARKRVTSVDVARRCGVSQSTVSLVLSGKGAGRVSARTAEAVRTAAAELGYRPNAAARALKTGAARTIVLVVPDVTNPFFGAVLPARSRPRARPATRSRWSTRPTTARTALRPPPPCRPARPTGCCSSPSTRRGRGATAATRSC